MGNNYENIKIPQIDFCLIPYRNSVENKNFFEN